MKMHIFSCLLLSVILSPLVFRECCGQESEDTGSANCSYWYEIQPYSQDCAHGARAHLICSVYAPREPDVDVRWHLTELEDDDLNNETEINYIASGVYSLQYGFTRDPTNISVDPRFAGLSRGVSILTITDFAGNQTGYYWCQMVISENIFLEPSKPASLTIGDQEAGCSRASFTIQPKCVAGPGITTVPTTTTTHVIATTTTIIQVSTTSTAVGESSSTPSPTSATAECEAGGVSCSVYAGIGVAIFVIVLCSLAILTVVCCIVNRKRSKKQHLHTAAPPPGDGEYYSYPEISLAHGKAAQPNTHMQTSENAYQSLIPGNEDYIHMYSRTIPSLGKEPVTDSVGSNRGHPTPQNDGQLDTLQVTESAIPVARHIYAAIDPGQIQPPNEYAQLQTP